MDQFLTEFGKIISDFYGIFAYDLPGDVSFIFQEIEFLGQTCSV